MSILIHQSTNMGRLTLSSFLALCFVGVAYGGTDCSFGTATNLLHKIAKTCPIPILHATDQTYCCEGGCCNLTGYLFSGYRVIIIIVITLIAVAIAGVTRCCTSFRKPGFLHSVQKPAALPVHSGRTGYRGFHEPASNQQHHNNYVN